MKKRVLSLFLILILVTIVGCGKNSDKVTTENNQNNKQSENAKNDKNKQDDKKVATVTIASGKDSANEEIWPTNFIKKMEEDLGINIELKKVTNEQLDLFLASGEAFVDIVRTPSGKEKQVIQAGGAVELDPYLEEYGQNILRWTDRNNLARELLSNDTGKLYFRRVQVGPESPEGPTNIWNGYVVRWDLYKELGAPAINNDDDYIDVLEKMVNMNPATETGEKVYGMGIDNSSKLWTWTSQYEANDAMVGAVKGLYLSLKDDALLNKYTDDRAPFWRSMAFFNKLYSKELLDPDSFTMTGETRKERAGKGMYVGAPRTWDVGSYHELNQKADPNTLKGHMPILPEKGGMSAWYGADPVAGWEYNSYYIPSSSKNIVDAVRVLDYLDNPDNLRSFYSGEKGVHWDIGEDGKPVVTEFGLELKSTGGDPWKKTGINAHIGGLAGLSGWVKHPDDGGFLNLYEDPKLKYDGLSSLDKDYADFYGVSYPGQLHVNQVKEGKAISRAKEPKDLFMVLGDVPVDMARIDAKLEDMLISFIPVMVTADPEKFEEEKAKAIKQLNKAGAEELFDWAVDFYNDADEKLQAAKKKHGIK